MAMRIPITDLLHRGVVTSLFGLTIYGVFMGVAVHRDTLKRGRGELSFSLHTSAHNLMLFLSLKRCVSNKRLD